MLDRLTWFKQSSYLWRGDTKTVYIDPWGLSGDTPEADVVFITHAHEDHFSPEDLEEICRAETTVVAPHDVARELSGEVVAVTPGDAGEAKGVRYQAVPAYNVAEERRQMHPRENNWVGYILTLGETTYYHAGDTDHAPELDSVRADVALVPVGGTYTMDVPEAAGLVKVIQPQLAVPMHYGFFEGAGRPSDGDDFKAAAEPVKVDVLQPLSPFTQR